MKKKKGWYCSNRLIGSEVVVLGYSNKMLCQSIGIKMSINYRCWEVMLHWAAALVGYCWKTAHMLWDLKNSGVFRVHLYWCTRRCHGLFSGPEANLQICQSLACWAAWLTRHFLEISPAHGNCWIKSAWHCCCNLREDKSPGTVQFSSIKITIRPLSKLSLKWPQLFLLENGPVDLEWKPNYSARRT